MKPIQHTRRIQTIRPRVLEIDTGAFRGYVDIQERESGVATSCKSQYCQSVSVSRDMAERQALALAKSIRAASRETGTVTQLLCESLNDCHAGRRELDNIPAFLIRPAKPVTLTRPHLRAVA